MNDVRYVIFLLSNFIEIRDTSGSLLQGYKLDINV